MGDPVLAALRERRRRTQAQNMRNINLTRQFTREVSTASRRSTKGLIRSSLRAASTSWEPTAPSRGTFMQPDVQPPPPPMLSHEERRINDMNQGFQWPT